MVVYEATKHDFMEHVVKDEIALKIYESYKNKIGRTSEREINSWNNSMNYMYKVLNTPTIPEECGIAIEYKIPATSRRIDFMLSGLDELDKNAVIIIELKQWDKVEGISERDGIIRTPYVGRAFTTHPSYQAWTYAKLISEYNESVQNECVSLYPCAYLHNYFTKENDPLTNEIYNEHIIKAPIFTKGDVFKLREFISKYIKKPDCNKTLYIIENGKKQVLIVEGGPGTGKSVLAVNLLVSLTSEDMVCQYVTKNSAPREVYSQMLQKNYKKGYIDNLFKGLGVFYECEKNEFDILIVDEAHRLGEKSVQVILGVRMLLLNLLK